MVGSSLGPGRRFVSLGTKLGLSVVIVVALVSALVFVWFSRRERDGLVAAKRTAAEMVSDLFAASLSAPLDFGDEDSVKAELANLRENPAVTRVGIWLAGSSTPLADFRAPGDPESTSHPRRRYTLVTPDYVETARVVAGRKGNVVGAALVRFSLAEENAAFRVNRVRILGACLLLAFVTVGLLLVLTRSQVIRPLDRLLSAARRLERGERNMAIGVVARDEIGRLARAFETMHGAVVDREEQLDAARRRLQKLFDHMRQAIVVFDRDGRIEATESRQAAHLFGGDVAGRSVRELLYPGVGEWDNERRAFEDWCGLAFDAPADFWSEVESVAPREVRLGEGEDARVLSLEFRPIDAEGSQRRVMLLATDETEKKRLLLDAEVQAERHAAEMGAMRRLVGGGGQQFVAFLEAARRRLGHVKDRVAAPMTALVAREVLEDVHTLKGEATAFDLRELAAVASAIEDRLVELRERLEAGEPPEKSAQLAAAVTTALDLLTRAEERFVEVSPTGRAVLDQTTVRRSDLDRMCTLASTLGGELGDLAARLSARSLGELAAPVAERAPGWATSAGKRARLDVEGREVLVPARLAAILGGALAHLVRNAIAHGIEDPGARELAGKPAAGVVVVRGEANGSELWPSIVVEDDGGGVAANPALSRVAAGGGELRLSDAPEAGTFRPSLGAPATGDLSGRGVGLNAVIREIGRAGYAVHLAHREGGGTRFTIAPRPPRGAS